VLITMGAGAAGTTTVTSANRVSTSRTITVCTTGIWIGGSVTNTGVCVGLSCGVGGVGAVSVTGAGSGVVVSGKFVVSVPVGMVVGGVNSGVVGVLVSVLEGSGSGVGVIVVVGDGSLVALVALEAGDGAVEEGVTEAVGEGVGVRQGPSVARGL